MTVAARLVLGSSLVIAVVMTAYGLTSLRQRERLISEALIRETETLAHALQIVANRAVAGGQVENLDRVLERVLQDPDMAISAVLGAEGRVVAGGPRGAMGCVEPLPAGGGVPPELHVWAECGGRVRLVVLPLRAPASALVVARRTTVVDRDTAASRRRILLTSAALAVFASLAIVAVLRFTLTRPLAEIMRGVRQLGGPNPPPPLRVPRAGGEPRDLALAFNEMVERLEGKRRSLIRETEERIELERRLRHAETFAALGRLTGGVAHELGSPLGVIGVRAEAIQLDPAAPASVRRHAEEIGAEVERIAQLVRDLMHVSRRHGLDARPVDLVPLVETVAAELRRQVDGAGIELSLDAPPRPVRVLGDETLLRHALHNVALNALQALRGHQGPRRLKLGLQRAGEVARIVVEDTGPGISPEHYPHLFEPFFTTKDVGEGSGLGLAISLGIVEEHGGTLTLVPAGGGGVRAHIDLPVGDSETERSE